jgi:hypothetical protein
MPRSTRDRRPADRNVPIAQQMSGARDRKWTAIAVAADARRPAKWSRRSAGVDLQLSVAPRKRGRTQVHREPVGSGGGGRRARS